MNSKKAVISWIDEEGKENFVKIKYSHTDNSGNKIFQATFVDTKPEASPFKSMKAANYYMKVINSDLDFMGCKTVYMD